MLKEFTYVTSTKKHINARLSALGDVLVVCSDNGECWDHRVCYLNNTSPNKIASDLTRTNSDYGKLLAVLFVMMG